MTKSDENITYACFSIEFPFGISPRKNSKQMGVARRPVSLHVLVRAKSERSEWSRPELKNAKRIAQT